MVFLDYSMLKNIVHSKFYGMRYSHLEGEVKDYDIWEEQVPFKRQLNKKEISKLKNILIESESFDVPKKIYGDKFLYVNKMSHIINSSRKGRKKKND